MRLAAAKCLELCLIVAALLIFLSGCGSTEDRVLEETSEKVYAVDPDANVSIQNCDGAVLIYGGGPNEMRVRAVKRAYSRERLNQIAIDVSTQAGAVSVITKCPPQPKWGLSDRSGTVDYTIVVPASATISAIDLNAGEVLLDSMRGLQVRARLSDGRIFARNCFTNLDLTVNRGTLGIAYDWWEQKKFSAQVKLAQGNASVWAPSDAAFRLVAYAGHGKIANDFNNVPVPGNSSTKGMNVNQIINDGGQATIEIKVDKGNIKIAEANP